MTDTDDFTNNPTRNCAIGKVDPDTFFATADTGQHIARKVCAGGRIHQINLRACPFTDQCFTRALATGEKFGVWGGVLMSAPSEVRLRQRRMLRSAEQVPA